MKNLTRACLLLLACSVFPLIGQAQIGGTPPPYPRFTPAEYAARYAMVRGHSRCASAYLNATVQQGDTVTVCFNDSVYLDAFDSLAFAYLWSTGETTPDIFADTAGTYTIVVFDSLGCTDTAWVEVISNAPLMTVSILPGDTSYFCTHFSVDLHYSNPAAASYLWNTGDTDTSITVIATGLYHLTVTDTNGCQYRDTAYVYEIVGPTIDLGPDTLVCEGNPLVLYATGAYDSVRWSSGSTFPIDTVYTGGTYYVDVWRNGCQWYDTVVVTGLPSPVIALGNDTSICEGTTLTLDAGSGGTTYLWNTGDATQTITISWTGTFVVLVTGANGCPMTDTINVTVMPVDTAAITTAGDSLYATAGFVHYQWFFNGTATGDTTRVIFGSDEEGTYVVVVTDTNGCITTSPSFPYPGRKVKAEDIPDGFSPNGDGVNDMWEIHNIDNYTECTLVIFNRYGSEVYSVTGYKGDWKGTSNSGADLPDGTYFYILDLKDGTDPFQHYVIINR